MGDIYNNPPQSRNEAILRATIDGTEYEAPPQSRMEDLLVELKAAIEQGGGIGNYNALNNKPKINSVTLQGDKSISDLFDSKVDIGVGTVEESGYAELKDENGNRIFRAGSANGGASVESGALIGQSGALVLYNGEGGLGSISPKGGARLVDVDLPAENGTLALDSQIASSQTPAKAAVVTVTDAAPINAEDITVDITPQQDLHGYDRPWAGGAGKNLANGGNQWNVNASGVIESSNFYNCYIAKVEQDQTYTFSANGSNSSIPLCAFFSSYPTVGSTSYNSSRELTKSSPFIAPITGYIVVRMSADSTETVQIEKGSIATPYTPYSNICPIEGWTGAELDRVGVNQWDEEWEVGAVEETGAINSALLNRRTTSFIRVQPNTEYYYKTPIKGGRNAFYNKAKQVVAYDYEGIVTDTFTTPDDAYYLRITFNSSYGTTYNNDISINYPSTDTSYHAYQGKQYTASFGETVYGGKWHVTAGGTDKTYGFAEFDGSEDEDWQMEGAPTAASGSKRFILLNVINYPILPSSYYPLNVITNGLSLASGDATWGGSTDNALSISPSGTDINIRVAGIDTVEGLKTWLSNNPVQLVYELATPTTISTPKQNVPMLKGINTVSADCGDVSLKYQPDNVIGELKGMIQALDARATALEEA